MAGQVTSTTVSTEATAEGTPPNAGVPEGGELILGKFKSQDDLIAAYRELESKHTQQSQQKVETPAPEAPAETPSAPTAEEVAKAEKKGIDFDALDREFRESGKLSDDTVAALEAAGFPRSRIEQHLAGIAALQSQMETRIASAIGGQDALKAALEWGASNLSQTDADAYEAALATNNEQLITQAVQGLHAKYEQAMGRTPHLLNGGNVPGQTGVKPFGSPDDIARAMSDPRYQEGDASYHAEVEARLRATYGI